MQQLTPAQQSRIKKRDERRRRKRERREDEYRRRIEELRRRIAEARKRRQRLLLMLLLALLAALESARPKFTLFTIRPEPDLADWTPSPEHDFAPAPGKDDHCDGYSYAQWNEMLAERGIRVSRKAELREEWKADPEREDFPQRYKDWGYRPYLGEIMSDLTDARHQNDALTAIKRMSPPETHRYLEEAYASDPADLLMCRANSSAEIVRNFQSAAIRWEFRKQREAEEAKRDKELSRKNDGDKGVPEPK